jgi:PPK2 family polyphosphate:nucleotide phosphotransferase
MFRAAKDPTRVPFDGSFRIGRAPTRPPQGAPSSERCQERLARAVDELGELETKLNADARWAVLVIFQAMDAAGKDGTIRAVMTGVSPAGVDVHPFKAPSAQELEHDFLWRTTACLPGRGQIGIFNRSYYEEVLVVRVHPKFLDLQRLPIQPKTIWKERCESIRDHERHLARSGTAIVKFWLNVSKAEQRRRFLARLEDPKKNWKFRPADIQEREHWKAYRGAYQDALRTTSRPWAPWYAVPADDKDYLRMRVAEILVANLRRLHPRFPKPPKEERTELEAFERRLRSRRV